MAHHPFGVKRIPELFIPRKFLELFFVKAKAVHACIDMDGRIRRLIHAITNLRPKPRLLQRVDNGFELRAQQHTFIPWRWAIKHINRRIRSNTITQDFTFARRGHEKDTASRAVKRTSHLGCAKAISICFHRGSNFGCANTFFDGLVIITKIVEVHAQGRASGVGGLHKMVFQSSYRHNAKR